MKTIEEYQQDAHAVRCMYCKKENGPDEGMFIVRRALKPRNKLNRWYYTGEYCCDDCSASGKPHQFGYYADETI